MIDTIKIKIKKNDYTVRNKHYFKERSDFTNGKGFWQARQTNSRYRNYLTANGKYAPRYGIEDCNGVESLVLGTGRRLGS